MSSDGAPCELSNVFPVGNRGAVARGVRQRETRHVHHGAQPRPARRPARGRDERRRGHLELRVVSKTRPSEEFAGGTNSDLSVSGQYAIQGNFNGYQVWDIADPK